MIKKTLRLVVIKVMSAACEAIAYNPDYPLVCFDESSKQLISEVRTPLPAEPGQVERYDYEYQREGVCSLFMMFELIVGWRHVEVTDHRTQIDYAQQIKLKRLYPSIIS